MAKVIKFALELKNGESARTIEDLRQHFDLEKVVAYFMNGRLLTWLKHRHLDDEAAALGKLSAEDAEFAKKLCEILGVAYDEHQKKADAIDANTLMADHERINRLRQVTTDAEILAKIDRVAFDEKDLRRLAFDNKPEVYLCNNRFVIPLNVQNKHYIGLGKAEAVIVSDEWVDFEEKGIRFTNVGFDEEYQQKAETPEKWLERGKDAWNAGNFEDALKWYRNAAGAGNGEAMKYIGDMHFAGLGVPQDDSEAIKWYKKAADAGYNLAIFHLGDMYYDGICVAQDYTEALKWYKLAAEKGLTEDLIRIGLMYWNGEGTEKDHAEANEWFKKAAEVGNNWGMNNLGNSYSWGDGVPQNYSKAREWYEKAADAGNDTAMVSLGDMYRDGKGISQDYNKAVEWYKKAADAGNEDAKERLKHNSYKGGEMDDTIVDAVTRILKGEEIEETIDDVIARKLRG